MLLNFIFKINNLVNKNERYEYQKMFDKAFEIYINLQDPTVFDFLIKHELFECAYNNLIELISLNKQVK